MASDPISWTALEPTASYILARTKIRPSIGIICGSGLGGLGELVEEAVRLDYRDIPGFPVSSAPGHRGVLIIGVLAGAPVVLMQGRVHVYEGVPLWKIALPVRVMKMLGVRNIIVTNAVGALNKNYQIGDVMLVRDHINLFGLAGWSPLMGPNDERFGPRFFAVNHLYIEQWRQMAREAAHETGMSECLREGVLTISGGPNFESVAELKMLSALGADCVGMSSIPECLVAHHCGIAVLAFCLVTNICTTEYEDDCHPNHQEVLTVAGQKEEHLKRFTTSLVTKIYSQQQQQMNNSLSTIDMDTISI